MDSLPKYDITIDPEYQEGNNELGIEAIAFTSNPAVIVKGVAFSSQKKIFFADDKKYRITAPAMIPMDIYRKDEDGEYEVTFKEDVIDAMHNKFMANLNNKDLFNLEHNAEIKVPAYILEAWIVDKPKEDKAYSTFGIEVPKGTLMVTAQVTDKDYYNKLVESGQTGFSIEGYLGLTVNEKESLNTYSMQLPDGEHLIDGKIYVVKDGVVVEVKEEVAMAEETVEETEMMEDPKEEEKPAGMEEVVEEEVKEETMAVDPATDAEAIIAIVTPFIEEKLNEVLQLIAELRNEMSEAAQEAGAESEEVEMSAFSAVKNYLNFSKQNG